MPFHALTALYLDRLGPAHFHFDDQAQEHAQGHSHRHAHDHSERHHHPADDRTVLTVEDDAALASQAPEESTASGWSASMCVALVAPRAAMHPPQLPDGIAPAREPLLKSRFLGRLERPPRVDRV